MLCQSYLQVDRSHTIIALSFLRRYVPDRDPANLTLAFYPNNLMEDLLLLLPCSHPAHRYLEFEEMFFGDHNIFQFLQGAVNIGVL